MPKNLVLRNGWYHYEFVLKGQKFTGTTRTKDLSIARRRLAQRREEAVARDFGERANRTFQDAAEKYGIEHAVRLKATTRARYRSSLGHLLDSFGNALVTDVSNAHLDQFEQGRRADGVTPQTIGRDFAYLSAVLAKCVFWGWVETNVAQRYVASKSGGDRLAGEPRTRFLSEREETAVLAQCDAETGGIIGFAIDTGLRKEELFGLRWEDVDLQTAQIRLQGHVCKSGRPRNVPLLPRALALLRSMTVPSLPDFVFRQSNGRRWPVHSSEFNQRLEIAVAAAVRAGTPMQPVRWHDLRRSTGQRLLDVHQQGLLMISRWLGHSSIVVTQRIYTPHADDSLHRALSHSPALRDLAEKAAKTAQQGVV